MLGVLKISSSTKYHAADNCLSIAFPKFEQWHCLAFNYRTPVKVRIVFCTAFSLDSREQFAVQTYDSADPDVDVTDDPRQKLSASDGPHSQYESGKKRVKHHVLAECPNI
jgi:hypothetical protein